MFSLFDLGDRGYNAINSYLTMTASHFIFPDHFSTSRNFRRARGVRRAAWEAQREALFKTSAMTFFLRMGFPKTHFIEVPATGVNAMLLVNDDFGMLVFRGTEMKDSWEILFKKDMFFNSRLTQVRRGLAGIRRGGGRVHEGLSIAYGSAFPLIRRYLDRDGFDSNKPLVVTGHSLGGAMATVAGFDLHNRGYNVHSVYSHAGYMPGNAAFGDVYERARIPYHRTVNKDDLVPEFPQVFVELAAITGIFDNRALRNLLNPLGSIDVEMAFAHVPGTVAYINHNNRVRLNPDYLEMRAARRPGFNIEHHETSAYRRGLFRDLPRSVRQRVDDVGNVA